MTINVTVTMPDKCEYRGRLKFYDKDIKSGEWVQSAQPDVLLIAGDKYNVAVWDTRSINVSEWRD